MLAIELLNEIDLAAAADRRSAVVRRDVQDRRFAVAEFCALIRRRHEAGAPLPVAARRLRG